MQFAPPTSLLTLSQSTELTPLFPDVSPKEKLVEILTRRAACFQLLAELRQDPSLASLVATWHCAFSDFTRTLTSNYIDDKDAVLWIWKAQDEIAEVFLVPADGAPATPHCLLLCANCTHELINVAREVRCAVEKVMNVVEMRILRVAIHRRVTAQDRAPY
jgi:hypothetical protein